MNLTMDEMEAKIAALEDRVSLLFQVTERLEDRVDDAALKWTDWAGELKLALSAITTQIDQISLRMPIPGKRSNGRLEGPS